MYLVIKIIINFEEDINRSFLNLRLDLKSLELELELKSPELELKLIVSSGIGIENNGIGIELKKWNWPQPWTHRYTVKSNIRPLVGNKIVDHSDVVGASPVGAAPTTSSFSP